MSKAKAEKPLYEEWNIGAGQSIRPAQFPGFTIWHLDAEQRKKHGNTKCEIKVTCGPAHAKTLPSTLRLSPVQDYGNPTGSKTSNNPKKKKYVVMIAGVRTEITIGQSPRWLFTNIKEACQFLEALRPERMENEDGEFQNVYQKYKAQFLEVLPLLKNRGDKLKIDFVTAVVTQIEQKEKANSPIPELITSYVTEKLLYSNFKLDDARGYKDYPFGKNRRNVVRSLLELNDRLGHKNADDVTAEDVADYPDYVVARRTSEENPEHKRKCAKTSLLAILEPIAWMYAYGKKADLPLCSTNPFAKLVVRLRSEIKIAKKAAGNPPPPSHDDIKAMFRTALEWDPGLIPAMGAQAFAGLRRVENLKSDNWCFNVENGWVELPDEYVKEGTWGRTVNALPIMQALMEVFPKVSPDAKFVPIHFTTYAKRVAWVRKKAGLPPLGKDGLRKIFTTIKQWDGSSMTERQDQIGNEPGSATTNNFYSRAARREWAEKLKIMTLEELFGVPVTPGMIPVLSLLTRKEITRRQRDAWSRPGKRMNPNASA